MGAEGKEAREPDLAEAAAPGSCAALCGDWPDEEVARAEGALRAAFPALPLDARDARLLRRRRCAACRAVTRAMVDMAAQQAGVAPFAIFVQCSIAVVGNRFLPSVRINAQRYTCVGTQQGSLRSGHCPVCSYSSGTLVVRLPCAASAGMGRQHLGFRGKHLVLCVRICSGGRAGALVQRWALRRAGRGDDCGPADHVPAQGACPLPRSQLLAGLLLTSSSGSILMGWSNAACTAHVLLVWHDKCQACGPPVGGTHILPRGSQRLDKTCVKGE